MTYRTSNVARLAGAASLFVVLAAWGLLSILAAGETTVSTWAVGLASMVPVSALLLGVAENRSPPRTGMEYALGLLASVVTVTVAYIGFAAVDYATLRAVVTLDPLQLLAAAAGFALLGGLLALVDLRYVERPLTAALLEERYLDEPVRGD